jgi:hypothetical protein
VGFSHLVGGAHMQRARVVARMNGDGAQTQIGRRPANANGDLAAICDQKPGDGHVVPG